MVEANDQGHRPALVTGATGLLGSHIAEQLRRRGVTVRAVCRPSSDTRFLERIGAQIVQGDLSDGASLRRACKGVAVVYHSAARVGDWGPWSDFVRFSVDGTRDLLESAAEASVTRFVHISSISVYGHVNGKDLVLDESAPLGRHVHRWSYYTRAKLEAERLAWQMHRAGRLAVSVIRPSWMYGTRDRATLPRLVDSIRRGKVRIIGDGSNRLNLVNAANVADAAILAGTDARAVGEAYNCSHDGPITQAAFLNTVAEQIGSPPIRAHVPYWLGHQAAFLMECFGHLFRTTRPPLVTRYALWLMGRQCFFECRKIREQLGWSSRIPYSEGIPAAVEDFLRSEAARRNGSEPGVGAAA